MSGEADPDIRRAALNLSCAVVSLPNAPQEMLTVVPRILECLMETLKVRIFTNSIILQGSAHIRTGHKILDGPDWTSQTKTKQKRQNWTSHSYFWPVLICAGPCRRF